MPVLFTWIIMGTTQIIIKGYDDVIKELNSMESKSKKVIDRTVGDFRSRGPGWVSQEVVKDYNIKKKEINSALSKKKSAGTIKISGTRIDNMQLIYSGRALTPVHFGMRPTTRPKNKSYKVTAIVKKSEGRKVLSKKAFLANSGLEGSRQIPFQRTTDKRYPIEPIRTISVPQMISNESVMERINNKISQELEKRLKHHVDVILKK